MAWTKMTIAKSSSNPEMNLPEEARYKISFGFHVPV
jgi:hypothetical protein